LIKKEPTVNIIYKNIRHSALHLQEFKQFNTLNGLTPPAVPTIAVCDDVYVGFSPNIEKDILTSLGLADQGGAEQEQTESSGLIILPLIGELDVDEVGLVTLTIVIGLVDGFNPCAMWVLLFLLSLLVNIHSRKKMIAIAGTFVIVSGVFYYLFMAAWLNIYFLVGFSRKLQIIIGLVAMAIGLVHFNDYLAIKRGFSLKIPDRFKPLIYKRGREIIQARSLGVAIVSVIILAVMVNTIEILCTAGLPAVYTQILASKSVGTLSHYGYLALYNLAYIFDDSLMVGIAVFTLSKTKLQEKHGRWLKLLGGLFIFALGLMLVLAPDSMF